MARGMTKAEAVRQVVRENPDLHAMYLRAYNEQHRAEHGRPDTLPVGDDGDLDEHAAAAAIRAWDAALQQKLAAGLDRARALRQIIAETPDIRSRYVLAVNSQARRRGGAHR